MTTADPALLEANDDTADQLLLLLAGQAQITLSEPDQPPGSWTAMTPGTIAYQPAGAIAQIQSAENSPAVVLVVRWVGKQRPGKPTLAANVIYPTDDMIPGMSAEEYRTVVFDTPTPTLKWLHCFFLTLLPGAVVPTHQHRDHDVLLIGLEGEIETHDATLKPFSVAYYRGGEPHGIRGVGQAGAKALAIEFYRYPPMLEQLRTWFRHTSLWKTVRTLKADR